MGFFDLPENSIGALTTRLSEDAAAIKGATGQMINIFYFTSAPSNLFFLCHYLAPILLSNTSFPPFTWKIILMIFYVFICTVYEEHTHNPQYILKLNC